MREGRGHALRESARALHANVDVPIAIGLAAVLAAIAFIAKGGLQLGSSTLVEAVVIVLAAVVVAVAVIAVGSAARIHGGPALAAAGALTALTALSILWSLYPSDSWAETSRTFAYLGAFAGGVAAVRLARARWPAILTGVMLALAAVSLWGLATKVAPGWLDENELYGRLRQPYGYWNAVGVTAAMAMPLCLWLGTRPERDRAVNALAWPLLGALIVTMMLSFSRGSIVAAVVGIALWLAIVPLRLRSLAVLLPSAALAAGVTAWAFSQSALTDDRIALADRKDAGVELGLILAAMLLALFAIGWSLQLLGERRPLPERTRRRIGTAAIAVVAVSPVLLLGGLAFTDRGIGGTISDRWHDLTSAKAVTPQNQPARLTETASVRSIYWRRAIDVWEKHKVAGAGAGSFAQAQLRFRREQAQAKHAHGYQLQTLADLGLIGLGVSLAGLAAWMIAAGRTLSLRRGWTRDAAWGAERTGLAALALVVIVFGAHSVLDWTWFIPALAVTAAFAAGWVAGRGPLEARAEDGGFPMLSAVRPALPRGPVLWRRGVVALAVLASAAVAVPAVTQEWRAQRKGDDALELAGAGRFPEARASSLRAKDLNPLSAEPYIELSAVDDAAGDRRGALAALQRAVQVEPANPEAWRRLGSYYLQRMSEPARAIGALHAALFLDPLSEPARTDFVAALRAQRLVMPSPGGGRNAGGPAPGASP